jgi:hypothetical protein
MLNEMAVKKLISNFKKQHDIKGSSKMKKAQLVLELEKRFEIKDNMLFLKSAPNIPPKEIPKKTVQPTIIQNNIANAPNDNGFTKGQQTYKNAISAVERKAIAKQNYLKDNNFASRLKGTI